MIEITAKQLYDIYRVYLLDHHIDKHWFNNTVYTPASLDNTEEKEIEWRYHDDAWKPTTDLIIKA